MAITEYEPNRPLVGEERQEVLGRFERAREARRFQIATIEAKLERGTEFIKAGHKMKGINPEGVALEIPLTSGQVSRLRENLDYLQGHHSFAGYYPWNHITRKYNF